MEDNQNMEQANLNEGTTVENEGATNATETTEGAATTATTPSRVMTEEAKEKQADTMKARWQDPVYKARVTSGRATKKIAKLEEEIAVQTAITTGDAAEDVKKVAEKHIEKLNAELAKAKTSLADAVAICGEEVAPTTTATNTNESTVPEGATEGSAE